MAGLQVKALDQMADVQGGWGYYTFETFSKRPIGEPTSFLTATVLLLSLIHISEPTRP